jgi:hypothetical protein
VCFAHIRCLSLTLFTAAANFQNATAAPLRNSS